MKNLRSRLFAVLALFALVASTASAGGLTITAHANPYTNYYDSLNVSVPAGAYASYYWYIITTGTTAVTLNGPGVSNNDTETSAGSNGGGSAFSGAGGVTGSVYASTGGGQAHASLTIGW